MSFLPVHILNSRQTVICQLFGRHSIDNDEPPSLITWKNWGILFSSELISAKFRPDLCRLSLLRGLRPFRVVLTIRRRERQVLVFVPQERVDALLADTSLDFFEV